MCNEVRKVENLPIYGIFHILTRIKFTAHDPSFTDGHGVPRCRQGHGLSLNLPCLSWCLAQRRSSWEMVVWNFPKCSWLKWILYICTFKGRSTNWQVGCPTKKRVFSFICFLNLFWLKEIRVWCHSRILCLLLHWSKTLHTLPWKLTYVQWDRKTMAHHAMPKPMENVFADCSPSLAAGFQFGEETPWFHMVGRHS